MKVGGKARKNQKISKIKRGGGARHGLGGRGVFFGRKIWIVVKFHPTLPHKKIFIGWNMGNLPVYYFMWC